MLKLVGSLVQKFIVPYNVVKGEDHLSEVIGKILQLMLCILDGLHSINDMASISRCSSQWAPVFELRNSRYYDIVWLFGVIFLLVVFLFLF